MAEDAKKEIKLMHVIDVFNGKEFLPVYCLGGTEADAAKLKEDFERGFEAQRQMDLMKAYYERATE